MAKNLKQGHNVLKNMVEVLDKRFLAKEKLNSEIATPSKKEYLLDYEH